MGDTEPSRMQTEPRCLGSVAAVTHYRMAQRRQVSANLMTTPRHELYFEQGSIVALFANLVSRARFLRFGVIPNTYIQTPILPQRFFDDTVTTLRVSLDDRQVDLVRIRPGRLRRLLDLPRPSKKEYARCLSIEAVDRPQFRRSTRLRQPVAQLGQSRAPLLARARHRE